MGNAGGFITLYRKMIDWEWYKDGITKDVFLHLLLKANFVDTKYKGIEIKRGQVMTSLTGISTDLGITIQQARTAIDHLKSTGEITDRATNQYRVITVVKYDDYQNSTGQATGEQQAKPKNSTGEQQAKQQAKQQQDNNINNNNKETNINKETIKRDTEVSVVEDFDFDVFWNEYPKKVDKQSAIRAWKKIKPDEQLMTQIMDGLRKWKDSDQWSKENGQYIPYPATWLNKRRWEGYEPQKKKKEEQPVKVVSSAHNFEERDYSDVVARQMDDLEAWVAREREAGNL